MRRRASSVRFARIGRNRYNLPGRRIPGLIAKLKPRDRIQTPVTELSELITEADVEQKLIYPFLVHPSFMDIPSEWVRTKEYMEPTEIDKGAGKRVGYIPDYSLWRSGFPLLVVEAKRPDEPIEKAIREAHLYANRINNRYPPNVNPIRYVLACNGEQFALAPHDSEIEVLYAKTMDLRPGTDILSAFKAVLNKDEFEKRAQEMNIHFQSRRFTRVPQLLTGTQVTEQLGINPFAQELFPIITRYFGQEADEAADDIIDRGYVSTEERTEYGAVLETYLKDRARVVADGSFQPVITGGKHPQNNLASEVRKHGSSQRITGRVQLVVGAVGSGKSLFIHRFFRRLMPEELHKKTLWAFLNFNSELKSAEELRAAVCELFIRSFCELNNIDLEEMDYQEKIFSHEMAAFDRGPAKLLKTGNHQQYNQQRYFRLKELRDDNEKVVSAISRHYSGEKRIGLVVVFDNVDKRSRDVQLSIFEAAQWFKELTRALVIVNLRDTTFEAHRDEPPLDAFINAVNFYIRSPRFALMIKKRLEIVMENIQQGEDLGKYQRFTLESGAQVIYKSGRLGEFLMSIYASLFDRRAASIGAALESLAGKNARNALGMFADIIASPHVPTSQIGSTAAASEVARIDEDRIVRALMRGRYRLFNNKLTYVRNILSPVLNAKRPSNFLYADILDFLIRHRKEKIDFSVEGYASSRTIVNRMGQLGYDEEDAFAALRQLAKWNLVEPESLLVDELTLEDPVQVHASGFIHMRYFLKRPEYLYGVTADMSFATYGLAEEAANVWGSAGQGEPGFRARQRILNNLADYFKAEYDRRIRRHAFYGDLGYGGKNVMHASRLIADQIGKPPPRSAAIATRRA
jgi:GTPase SAR1 family protein